MPDREGPTLVTPEPFYTCDGCCWLHVARDAWGNPWPWCVFAEEAKEIPYDPGIITPSWCPLLNDVKGEENE